MKKVVFKGIAASLVLSLSLAGCGSGSPAPSAAPSSSPESQSETTPVVVKLGVVGESNWNAAYRSDGRGHFQFGVWWNVPAPETG